MFWSRERMLFDASLPTVISTYGIIGKYLTPVFECTKRTPNAFLRNISIYTFSLKNYSYCSILNILTCMLDVEVTNYYFEFINEIFNAYFSSFNGALDTQWFSLELNLWSEKRYKANLFGIAMLITSTIHYQRIIFILKLS